MADKKADLAGPGIGNYDDLKRKRELPDDYEPLLSPMETMQAVFAIKNYIEENLCKALNLQMVQVPLIVDRDSGVNDYLDRDGSRTPVEFPCGLGLDKPITAQVVQAATKWKRMALKQFDCQVGEGICTDMKAVRKDYFLDHDHSAYVDQWDWERVITKEDRTLEFLKDVVAKIWKVIWESGRMAQEMFPQLKDAPALFIIGIGWPLKDGYPHEMRAADYDDWVTESIVNNDEQYHGLNGDILVWNPVTKRRHELTSMGIRVTKETLKVQLKMSGQEDFLSLPYHQALLNDEIPLSIGGGIGQSRTYMYLLRTAHLGEVSVTVWPKILKDICAQKNIHVLE
jgi:aspartate--ammonia ligase